jgi:hypothetical protein
VGASKVVEPVTIGLFKRVLKADQPLTRLAEKMYLDWAKEKKLLNMTSIFAEMYLVSNEKKEKEFSDFAFDQICFFSRKEWGEDTVVHADPNFILITNDQKKREAKFYLDPYGVIVLNEKSY